jgi:malic enzyme
MFLEGLRKTREMKIRVSDVLVEILRQNKPEYKPEGLIPQPNDWEESKNNVHTSFY